jgi:glycosyltransferase involved in cell wall biosynthesis
MISVVVAAYNGEQYLAQQLESVLPQLGAGDELIVSDDGSTDGTRELVKTFERSDSRVRLIDGPCRGVIRNFENGLCACRGDIIFLCDQDDVWHGDKVEKVLAVFAQSNADVVVHDAEITDPMLCVTEQSFFKLRGCGTGLARNLLKNSYIGCCMALQRRMLRYILPFPKRIPMHDQWIGLLGELFGKVVFYPERLVLYRRHGANQSQLGHGTIFKMLYWRIGLTGALLHRKLSFGSTPLQKVRKH